MSVELGSEQPVRRRLAVPETLIALGLLLFAGVALLQIWAIPASPIYASVGPTAFPYAVVAGLAILAMLMLVEAVRGGWQPEEERAVRLDWRALGHVRPDRVRIRQPPPAA
jgi:putative tricarboxylic transport membrane protein